MSSPTIDEESPQESVVIKIQCSSHLLKKYAFLEEAFTDSNNYFIQVTESDESNRTGGGLLLKLHKQSYNDGYDNT